jgi:polyhydroxyalkanoate synthesis regulator protein
MQHLVREIEQLSKQIKDLVHKSAISSDEDFSNQLREEMVRQNAVMTQKWSEFAEEMRKILSTKEAKIQINQQIIEPKIVGQVIN